MSTTEWHDCQIPIDLGDEWTCPVCGALWTDPPGDRLVTEIVHAMEQHPAPPWLTNDLWMRMTKVGCWAFDAEPVEVTT